MRKVVDSIIQGQLDRKFGPLTFSVNAIEHSINSGETVEGSFSVFAVNHALCEGHVISDDYRMEVINPTFSGAQDEIAYRFRAEELSEGHDVRGNFIILSNRGEYTIPFSIHVEPIIIESSLGPIRNIFHFTNLAKSNWNEAVEVFYNPHFEDIFRESDRDYLPLYRCLSGVPGSVYNMDEFLISIRKKTPVEYIASESSFEIADPVGVSRYSFNISRNGWGYTHLCIEAEGDFLEVDKENIYQEDFLGNNYTAYYYVDASKLHSGKNYGSIILKDNRHTVKLPVLVHKDNSDNVFKAMTTFRRKSVIQIMEYYQAYRFKKISARTWMAESNKVIDKMLANDSEDLMARLYQIHVMLTQERYNEANWNLKTVKTAAESVRRSQPYLWCYYIYLCTLSDAYADQIEENVAEVNFWYKQHPDDWRIAWLLSYMSDEYKNMIRKWVMYEKTYENGCTSPLMYMEAAKLMLDNPELLTKFEGFEIQIIRYICKKNLMTEELIFVVRSLAERVKEYSESVIKILTDCYRDFPHDELLMVICSQLMKGNRTDKDAFTWYAYAVNQELKVTRLYEYYMMSVDKSEPIEIPRTVLMYFSFHSDLDYETNAYLYSIILNNKDKDPDMYSRYQTQMDDFVAGQLLAGHNNRYLCQLYRNMIGDHMLADDILSTKVADIIFIHEIDVSAYPDARNLILCYGHHDEEEKYPITGKYVEVPIFSDDYCIALEDDRMRRYVISRPVEVKPLIAPGRLVLNLQLMLRNHIGLDVHCCMEHHMTFDVRMENEFRFRNLLEKKYFSVPYAQNITMKLVRYYYDQDRLEDLDQFLSTLDAGEVSYFERSECVRYLVKRNMYEKAMEWIYRFGPEGVDKSILADLLYSWVPTYKNDADRYGMLIKQLLIQTLPSIRTNNACMEYLVERADGTARTLRDIWVALRDSDVSSRELDEKILIQLLYTSAYIQERSDILSEYAYSVPDGDVLRAVLYEAGYEFFVLEGMLSDQFFRVLAEAMESDIELHKVCYLAYVSYYAQNKDMIDDKVRPLLKDALHILLNENIVLACFKELADLMPSMSHFASTSIIEYRTSSDVKVNIHYIIESDNDGEYLNESMNEIYGGVYSKAFTLFFGERLMYYITEDDGDEKERLSESKTIVNNDIDDNNDQGRFGIINDICIGKTLSDYTTVDTLLEEYFLKDYMSGKLFGMHKG